MAVTSVLYLDVDDEITSAAARVRSADARRVAVVLPYGSRVATSRINFRLLARDAMTHEKRLSIVAADAATRALAASAGLPVFSSVGEYEASEEGGPSGTAGSGTTGEVTAAAVVAGAAASAPDASATMASGTEPATSAVVPPADTSATTVERAVPAAAVAAATALPRTDPVATGAGSVVRPERVSRPASARIGRTPIAVGLAVVALAIVVGGVAAYLLLPSASIAITPREETIGPVSFAITADPNATAPDVEAGVVPAAVLDIPVAASETFPATGKRVEEAPATGTVQFENRDFTASNAIAKGAIVSTESGIDFRTDRAITVPRAELVGLTVQPSFASVPVTAVDAGPEGNVAQNTIQAEPRGESPFLLVTNPDPTTGGTRTEFPRVTQEDVDGARTALQAALTASFEAQLDDPALGGGDVTVFPATAVPGSPVWSVDPDTIVGQEVESFDLGATAPGTVTAVDTAPVETIAEERLTTSVEPGFDLVPGSSAITVDPALVSGGVVSFPVTVTARQVQRLDAEAIEAEIRGLPLPDAEAVLEAYGTPEIDVWPDWVGSIPTIDGRVVVTIDSPVPVETPSPSPGTP